MGIGVADWILADKNSTKYRFFSSALINNVLLIDHGPHIFLSAEKFSVDLSKDILSKEMLEFGIETAFDNWETKI